MKFLTYEAYYSRYPTDSDKQMLAKQTGLTRNQASEHFMFPVYHINFSNKLCWLLAISARALLGHAPCTLAKL
jgi:hypothetical protein